MARVFQADDGGVAKQAVPAQPVSRGTFRALRHRNYRLFFYGQLISLIGTWMQVIAQQYLVYRLTGEATMLGTISVLGLIPLLPMSLWGGSLADRLPKRAILIVTQTLEMLQAFALAVLIWTHHEQVWQVMLLALLLAAIDAVDMPVRQAFVVEMVEGKEDLTNAIGLNSTIFNASRVLGPALAGVAVALTGEAGAFFINGLSFLAVIVSLLMMRLPPHNGPKVQPSLASHLKEGMQYVRQRQTVMVLISLVAVSAFLSMPFSILLPVFATKVLNVSALPFLNTVCGWAGALGATCQSPDALTYGLLQAAVGVGALLGALFVASLPANARRGGFLTLGNVFFPALVIGLALSRSFAASMILLLGVGVSFVVQNALANTLIQFAVTDDLRGRVMSIYTMVFQSMMRVGGLQAGLMGDTFGAPFAVGIGGVISLAYGLFVAIRYPRVREMG